MVRHGKADIIGVIIGVCLDFIQAMDFWGSEYSEEKVYEVYILFELSWSAESIGTGAASYKQLVQVSLIFSDFTESFLELSQVYSYSVVPWLTAKMSILLWITIEIIKCLNFFVYQRSSRIRLSKG